MLDFFIFILRLTVFSNRDYFDKLKKGYEKQSLNEKGATLYIKSTPLFLLEAASGFEPENNGFADRCLSHLAMPP